METVIIKRKRPVVAPVVIPVVEVIKRKRPVVAPVVDPVVAPVIIKTKKVSDYSKGKIYKITSPNSDQVYIGSTVKSLNDRLCCHIYAGRTTNIYSKIVIDKGKAKIELIELFPCKTRTELCRREGEIIKATLNCCNKFIAGRTIKEWIADNAVMLAQYKKQYCIDNAEAIAEKAKQYRIENAASLSLYRKQYLLKRKEKEKLNQIKMLSTNIQ